jgi:hypothetical protein
MRIAQRISTFAALLTCLTAVTARGSDVVISEFMAINDSTFQDGDGNYSDWIEIYNPTDHAVNLKGWYLTDEVALRTKWPFPDFTLQSGAYLVVFASNQQVTNYVDKKGYFHTNFGLNGDSDYLALVRKSGTTTTVVQEFYPTFPKQLKDVSYGISDAAAVSDTVLIPSGAAVRYRVPTAGDEGADWTSPEYDDSGWVSTFTLPAARVVVTEVSTGAVNWVEVQNVSSGAVDTSGRFVAVNDPSSGNINDALSSVWNLPPSLSAGQILYRTDSTGDNYWGSNIPWNEGGAGWAMIVDDAGGVVDFVSWGYTASEIASLDVNVNGFYDIRIGREWRGDAVAASSRENPHIVIVTDDPANESDYVDFLTETYGPSSIVETISVLVDVGTPWRYFKGTQHPSDPVDGWIQPEFNDSGWLTGPTGIGYGDDDDATVLNDMRDNYVSVFCRKEFEVEDIASIESIVLKVAYDDGFIAYLNGDEVGRENMGQRGDTFTFSDVSTDGVGALPESVTISVPNTFLREGRNVLAIQVHNSAVGSSDLSMIPALLSRRVRAPVGTSPGQFVGDKSDLLDANLVVVSLHGSSGACFGDRAWWNQTLSVPLILHSAHLLGTDGWGWLEGNATTGGATWDVDAADDLLHFVNVSGGHVTMYDPDPGYQISGDSSTANGDAVAWYSNQIAVAAWAVSQSFDNGDAAGSNRIFFAAPGGVLASITDDGKQFLRNALAKLYTPEFGATLKRTGGSDRNMASDFEWTWSDTKGAQNPGVSLPFTGNTLPAITGIGFSGAESPFASAIQTNVADAMQNVNSSLWTRFVFTDDDLSPSVAGLKLRMKYDDGFVAYLNGVRVAEFNAPSSPTWNSAATAGRDDYAAAAFHVFDITTFLNALQEGANVLAIHGLNVSAGDGDFLLLPELIATNDPGAPRYMTTPTPERPNIPGAMGTVADTRFSVDRGFFSAPFEVEITTETRGAEIHYTVDGSEPTATHGEVYTGPITISGQTILRAAAFRPGYIPTNVDTQTYIFLHEVLTQGNSPAGYPSLWKDEGSTKPADYEMDPEIVNSAEYASLMNNALTAIPSLSIVTDKANLFDSATGIYMNPEGSGEAWERAASVELIDPGNVEEFQIDCGLRIQGGASRLPVKSPKHSFRLLFKGDYGAKKLDFALFGQDAVDEFDTVVLRAGFNNSWVHWAGDQRSRAQYARDRFARYTQLAMGQHASNGRYVHLYINGMYWGVYDLSERPTAPFMAAYYGGDKEDYDTLNSGSVRDGDSVAWGAMFAMANAGLAGNPQYQAIQQYLDVDNLIDFMITNHYGGNQDWDQHNWYAGRKREPGAGFKFFCWDSERTLEGVSDNVLGVNNDGCPSRLYQQLRQNAEFRIRYADHLHRHFFNGGALTPQAAADCWKMISSQIDLAIIAESARWGDYRRDVHPWSSGPYELYTKYDHYDVEKARLINDYFLNRLSAVLQQYRSAGLYPSTAAPAFKVNNRYQHGGLFAAGDFLSITASYPVYYTTDGTDPRLPGGAVSPGAKLFSGSIVLTESIVVKSRTLNGNEWSALNEAIFVLRAPSALRITEIMYNPVLGDEAGSGFTDPNDFEFIELQNTGNTTIGLAGVRFTEGINFDFTTGAVTRLAPGGFVVVVKNLEAFRERYANWQEMNIAGEYEGSLENGGETIELQDGVSKSNLAFTYDGSWYWAADGAGFSLVPVDPDSTGELSAREFWRVSAYRYGSPGEADAEPTTPEILVNEALTHTEFPDVNRVELYNPSGEQVDLGGWWLSDDAGQPEKYTIPPGTIIEEYLTILEDDDLARENPIAPACYGIAFTLSPRGGFIYLHSPDLRYRHGFAFGAAEKGVSFGRYLTTTGAERFPAQAANSFDSVNPGPRVGPVVISEIMYHPLDTDDEFLELANVSDSTVQLYQPDNPGSTWKVPAIGFTLPPYVEVPPGGHLLLVRDTISASEFRAKHNVAADVEIFIYSGALDNAGEDVSLQKPVPGDEGGVLYVVVDEVEYDDEAPWPTQADGLGPSLERVDLTAYGADVANWKRSPSAGGTPGWDASTLDGDGDGMPDAWEEKHGLDPLVDDSTDDPDGDLLNNLAEYQNRTDPNDPDSDDDGVSDGAEVNVYGTNPRNADSDGDGYTDGDEVTEGQSDPLDSGSVPPDNDMDRTSDINDPDDDNDGMPDTWENEHPGLNPMTNDANEDNDADGQVNYAEYLAGTDPLDPSSVFAPEEIAVTSGALTLKWSSVPGKTYRVWQTYDLVNWVPVSGDIAAQPQTGTTEWTTSIAPGEKRAYYRIEVLPTE